jgi:hypothetical protein
MARGAAAAGPALGDEVPRVCSPGRQEAKDGTFRRCGELGLLTVSDRPPLVAWARPAKRACGRPASTGTSCWAAPLFELPTEVGLGSPEHALKVGRVIGVWCPQNLVCQSQTVEPLSHHRFSSFQGKDQRGSIEAVVSFEDYNLHGVFATLKWCTSRAKLVAIFCKTKAKLFFFPIRLPL